jgi:predicted PurR-regulated permease PerM
LTTPPPATALSTNITPNNPNPVPTDRYIRLLVVLTTFLLLMLTVYLAVRVLEMIHHTVLLFALGGLLAYALDPIVEIVRGNMSLRAAPRNTDSSNTAKRKLRPRWLGVLAVFVALFGALGIGTVALGREAIHQGTLLAADREHLTSNAKQKVTEADAWLKARGIPANLTHTVEHPPEQVRLWGESFAKSSLGFAGHFSRGFVEGIIVLLITAYFLLFSEEMRAMLTRVAPERLRPYLSQWQDDVNRILGGFVRGQAILALTLGAGAGIACLILGLRFWLLIGVFVVFASLIPVLGPYIGAIPAIISALLTPPGALSSAWRVAIVVLLFFIINEAGSKILYPKLVGKALGLHEVLVLFALLAGFEVGGIVGVLFAAPMTALALVTIDQLYRIWLHAPPDSVADAAEAGGEQAQAEGIP